MNSQQSEHLNNIVNRVIVDIQTKYVKGQNEHGGNLWDRDVIIDAIQESIDQLTYVYTIDFKRRQAVSCIQSFLSTKNEQHLQQAIEWLTQKSQ